MKKIDLLTVLISSATLLLFCFSSFLLLWQYAKIRDDIDLRNNQEIELTIEHIRQLDDTVPIDRVAVADQLESNIRVMQGHQQEWQLLRQTLSSFVFILVIIVLSHLIFVYTLVKSKK